MLQERKEQDSEAWAMAVPSMATVVTKGRRWPDRAASEVWAVRDWVVGMLESEVHSLCYMEAVESFENENNTTWVKF